MLAWRPRSTLTQEPKQLTWFDRSGKKLGTLGEPAVYFAPTLSPDEKSLAVCRTDPATNTTPKRDLWIFDVARGTSRRLTFDPADDCGPAWSPDGSRIAFFSDRRGVREIYQKAANGSGDDELLLASKDQECHDPLGTSTEDWSADGRFLVLQLPRCRHPLQRPLPAAHVSRRGAEADHLSRDGGRRVHGRNRSQRQVDGLSVRLGRGVGKSTSATSRRGVSAGPGKWQVSTGGGWQPRWRRDGKELFYTDGATIMAVAVKPDAPSFEAAAPRPLFDVPFTGAGLRDRFAVTRDGQRFLVNLPLKPAEPVRVLVNWLPPGP